MLAHGVDESAPRVVRDDAARLPGRGAWVHDDERCKQQAVRKRALRRALRVTGDVELGFPEPGDANEHHGDGHVTSPMNTQEAYGYR